MVAYACVFTNVKGGSCGLLMRRGAKYVAKVVHACLEDNLRCMGASAKAFPLHPYFKILQCGLLTTFALSLVVKRPVRTILPGVGERVG